MKILRILIVESEMSLAMDLEMMIQEIASATFVTEASVGAAKKVLHEDLDFAFLDVDVTKGKTFEIAEILERKHVPYAFISASRQDQLPLELRRAPFIPKPFYAAQIEQRATGHRSLISNRHRTSGLPGHFLGFRNSIAARSRLEGDVIWIAIPMRSTKISACCPGIADGHNPTTDKRRTIESARRTEDTS